MYAYGEIIQMPCAVHGSLEGNGSGGTCAMKQATAQAQTGRVLMLSGPVGAGKTTVGRLLLPLLHGPWAYLEGDTFLVVYCETRQALTP